MLIFYLFWFVFQKTSVHMYHELLLVSIGSNLRIKIVIFSSYLVPIQSKRTTIHVSYDINERLIGWLNLVCLACWGLKLLLLKLNLSNVHSLMNEYIHAYKYTYPSFLFLCLLKDVLFKREKIRNPWIFLLSWNNIIKMQFVLKDYRKWKTGLLCFWWQTIQNLR